MPTYFLSYSTRKSISLNSDSFRAEVMNWYPDWRSIAFCDYISSDIGPNQLLVMKYFPESYLLNISFVKLIILMVLKDGLTKELLSMELWSLYDVNWYYECLNRALVALSLDWLKCPPKIASKCDYSSFNYTGEWISFHSFIVF